MQVKSVRYFKTNRGLGYEAKTNDGTIWNNGMGGETYFEDSKGRYVDEISGIGGMDRESYLESLIDTYEGVKK
tara:strand:+ start:492 stop:710 length:219 start_codon:yes stop_codon:yes gene_type:complete